MENKLLKILTNLLNESLYIQLKNSTIDNILTKKSKDWRLKWRINKSF